MPTHVAVIMDGNRRNDVRVSVMGNKSRIPESLQKLVYSVQDRSKANKGVHLVIAIDYSGRYDITQANKKIAKKVKDGVLQVEDIDDTLFEQHLETSGIELSNPDLMIRTSGELRVSNFMLWQLAYSELFFVDKLFPDFGGSIRAASRADKKKNQIQLAEGLDPDLMPKHVAVILDGNRRTEVRLSVVESRRQLPKTLQNLVSYYAERAKANKGPHLVTTLNCSATKKIARKTKHKILRDMFEEANVTIEFPNPDLIIRTRTSGGELRVSSFLMRQLAYPQLLFVDKLFPDFDQTDFVKVLKAFQQRQRRYGDGGYKYW
ncbi:dehydrodolichyl diphosphate synthase 2 [Phtheirospermum japonicum]|uniref:Alkyl transferase n=1 Tax=Phtheirospermum japonicum TaxID=374723 RepID=A0A830CPB4_9LAMI|nr:dehydrodolichyl diphosphate synthase 2 [Phtheirospermum japonicum]